MTADLDRDMGKDPSQMSQTHNTKNEATYS
jgi:hypothetical protein